MYGMFILPLVHGHRDSSRKIRLLEIGMGCDMFYGPGKSLAIWREMFRGTYIYTYMNSCGNLTAFFSKYIHTSLSEGLSVDIWMAEFDKECVASARAKGQLDGVHVLVGDQADRGTLQVRVTYDFGQGVTALLLSLSSYRACVSAGVGGRGYAGR